MDWKHHSYTWEALVVYQDETLKGSPLVWKWFPVELLRPLYPDPNPRMEIPHQSLQNRSPKVLLPHGHDDQAHRRQHQTDCCGGHSRLLAVARMLHTAYN